MKVVKLFIFLLFFSLTSFSQTENSGIEFTKYLMGEVNSTIVSKEVQENGDFVFWGTIDTDFKTFKKNIDYCIASSEAKVYEKWSKDGDIDQLIIFTPDDKYCINIFYVQNRWKRSVCFTIIKK